MVAGNEGILSKAETAVSETKISGAKEQAELLLAEVSADYYEKRFVDQDATASGQKIKEYITAQIGTAGKVTSNGDYTVTVDASGNVTVTDEAGNEVVTGTLEETGKAIWVESAGGSGSEESGSGGSSLVGETYYGDASVQPTDQKYFTFTVNEDGQTATITGIKDDYAVKTYYSNSAQTLTGQRNIAINDNGTYITEVVVPCQYVDEEGNKYTVTSLSENVFGYDDSYLSIVWGEDSTFRSIKVPNTIDTIKKGTFANLEALESITIPESVTSIGDYAFAYCTNLSSINIPSSVTSIGEYAFYFCKKLSTLSIPEGVTSIGENIFGYCDALSSINIPESVTSIGYAAFTGCKSLSSIKIPANVTGIVNVTFRNCTNLTTVTIDSSTIASGITGSVF